MKPLAIIPTYIRTPQDASLTLRAIHSLRATAGDSVDVLVVDDCSPNQELVSMLRDVVAHKKIDFYVKDSNDGFSATVNIGLRAAQSDARDAILVNADIQFFEDTWLDIMLARPEAVVGGLLLYGNGLVQHAGIYWSMIHRMFDHMYRFSPGKLGEANKPRYCPVTGALMRISSECLQEVGIMDEDFKMAWEDVDYCLRVFQSGRKCVYEPAIRAFHYESMFRGQRTEKLERWTREGWEHLTVKHAGVSFADWVPTMLWDLNEAAT